MKKLFLLLPLAILSASSFATLDLEGFKEDLEKTVRINRVVFRCGDQIEWLMDINKKSNRVVEIYGAGSTQPLREEICNESIQRALEDGIPLEEIELALLQAEE